MAFVAPVVPPADFVLAPVLTEDLDLRCTGRDFTEADFVPRVPDVVLVLVVLRLLVLAGVSVFFLGI